MKNNDGAERRLDWGHFVDRVFWGILVASAIFISSRINKMGESIDQLNQSMAVVLYQNSESHDRLNKMDGRIDRLDEIIRKRR